MAAGGLTAVNAADPDWTQLVLPIVSDRTSCAQPVNTNEVFDHNSRLLILTPGVSDGGWVRNNPKQ